MYSVILHLEYQFLNDAYTTATSKSLWVSCYRDLAVLEGDTMVLGLNEMFLPVSEEALRDLRTISLPLMTSIYTGQTWVTTTDDADMRSKNLYERQKEIMDRLDNDILKGEAILENERKLAAIRESVLAQQLASVRATLEAKKQELEAAKAKLYETHRPLATDDPYIVLNKGIMFASFDMVDAALEAFYLFSQSQEPHAAAIGNAASHFVVNRSVTGISQGVIVAMYEPDKPVQPEILIGDIIFTVNGVDIANDDDYFAALGSNAASELLVLRFTDAGYERLKIQLDPNAGLLGVISLSYK